MTDEQTAKIQQWLGRWKPGEKCEYAVPADGRHVHTAPCGKRVFGGNGFVAHSHDIPCPPLTDADAMACLRKLLMIPLVIGLDNYSGTTEFRGFDHDPAEAIFSAVLDYLERSND